jgi:hypothetical protein
MRFLKLYEEFIKKDGVVSIVKPYDDIKKINIDGNIVYSLFGDIMYYPNKESILAIKGKSNKLILNNQTYENFLKEFEKRFYSIAELSNSDILVSVETSSNINDDIMNVVNKPFIREGFKKTDNLFKMRSLKNRDRLKVNNLFNRVFDVENGDSVCVVDDFITSGSTFRNAFQTIPDNINKVGVCLFYLK